MKNKNIHVLPTDKPSKLYKEDSVYKLDNLVYGTGNQNIYITSDEKIKKRDWCINSKNNNVMKVGHHGHHGYSSKKIILTTDQDLIKDGVQAIDDEFLEWFVKNPSCEKIYVNKIESFDFEIDKYVYNYKIIIQKEELYNETQQKSLETNKEFVNSKSDSKLNNLMKEFDNYEVEESNFTSTESNLIKEAKKVWEESHPNPIEMSLFGAKWQAERMYSEEDIKRAIRFGFDKGFCSNSSNKVKNNLPSEKEWFEQFKKK